MIIGSVLKYNLPTACLGDLKVKCLEIINTQVFRGVIVEEDLQESLRHFGKSVIGSTHELTIESWVPVDFKPLTKEDCM